MLSLPQAEVGLNDIEQEKQTLRRLNLVVGFLAVLFVLLMLVFAGYYYYTKYVQLKETPEQKEITRAIQMIRDNPRNSSARVRLGVLYTQAGMLDEAIEQFDEALKIARDDQEALVYAGIAYMNKEQYDKALTYFNKTIKYYKNINIALEGKLRDCKVEWEYLEMLKDPGDSLLLVGESVNKFWDNFFKNKVLERMYDASNNLEMEREILKEIMQKENK